MVLEAFYKWISQPAMFMMAPDALPSDQWGCNKMNYFWSLEITLHVLLSPLTGMVDLSDLHLCQWSSSRRSSVASSPQNHSRLCPCALVVLPCSSCAMANSLCLVFYLLMHAQAASPGIHRVQTQVSHCSTLCVCVMHTCMNMHIYSRHSARSYKWINEPELRT